MVPVVRYWAINRVTCCREYPLTSHERANHDP